jgi:hypothetical protein
LSLIDGRIAAESDPTQHPLHDLVAWHLDKRLTPCDGGQLFDRLNQLVMAAIDTAIDDALECLED